MKLEYWIGCALALSLMAACDGDGGTDAGVAPGEDAGETPADAGMGVDGGMVVDDAGTGCGCEAGEVCVRDVCIASCGVEAETIEGGLGAGLVPVTNFCRPTDSRTLHDGEIWDVTSALEGTVTTFTVSRWTPSEGGISDLTELGTFTHDTGDTAVMTFPGFYLAVSPDGSRAALGYTDSTTDGEVLVEVVGGTDVMVDAEGNFDAAFLDASTLLVNGLGLGASDAGQGVYAVDLSSGTPTGVNIMTNMGDFSGSVAATSDFVIAGGVDGTTFAGTVYAVSRTAIEAAITGSAIDAVTLATEVEDADGVAISSSFTMVRDRLVSLPFGGPVTSYAVDWDGTDVTLSDATVLATGEAFSDVVEAPADRLLLVHAGGMLLVE